MTEARGIIEYNAGSLGRRPNLLALYLMMRFTEVIMYIIADPHRNPIMFSLHYISEYSEQNSTNSTCIILLSTFADIMPSENNRFWCGSIIMTTSVYLTRWFSTGAVTPIAGVQGRRGREREQGNREEVVGLQMVDVHQSLTTAPFSRF